MLGTPELADEGQVGRRGGARARAGELGVQHPRSPCQRLPPQVVAQLLAAGFLSGGHLKGWWVGLNRLGSLSDTFKYLRLEVKIYFVRWYALLYRIQPPYKIIYGGCILYVKPVTICHASVPF